MKLTQRTTSVVLYIYTPRHISTHRQHTNTTPPLMNTDTSSREPIHFISFNYLSEATEYMSQLPFLRSDPIITDNTNLLAQKLSPPLFPNSIKPADYAIIYYSPSIQSQAADEAAANECIHYFNTLCDIIPNLDPFYVRSSGGAFVLVQCPHIEDALVTLLLLLKRLNRDTAYIRYFTSKPLFDTPSTLD